LTVDLFRDIRLLQEIQLQEISLEVDPELFTTLFSYIDEHIQLYEKAAGKKEELEKQILTWKHEQEKLTTEQQVKQVALQDIDTQLS